MNGPEAITEAFRVAPVFAIILLLVWLLAFVVSMAITLVIWCKLFAKAGYHWAYGLLVLVPIANIVVPFYLAFADWPIRKELRQLRQQQAR